MRWSRHSRDTAMTATRRSHRLCLYTLPKQLREKVSMSLPRCRRGRMLHINTLGIGGLGGVLQCAHRPPPIESVIINSSAAPTPLILSSDDAHLLHQASLGIL